MARPTGCTKAMIDKAQEYLTGGYEEVGHVIPTASGLALYLGVCRTTVYNWKDEKTNKYADEITTILENLQATQEMLSIAGGLTGKFNPTITARILANHGYSEKHAMEHSGAGGGAIRTESKIEWVIQPVKPIDEKDADG